MADYGDSGQGAGTSEWEALLDGRGETAPTKPTMPAFRPERVHPEPVDDADDADDVVAPVLPPDAQEIQPEPGSRPFAPVLSMPLSPYLRPAGLTPADAPRDEADDPLRRLGASAVANATLHASGAPTPMAGVPMVPTGSPRDGSDDDSAMDGNVSFGDDEPAFTPRFEPRGVVFTPEHGKAGDPGSAELESAPDAGVSIEGEPVEGSELTEPDEPSPAVAAAAPLGATLPASLRIPELEDSVASAAPYRPTMQLASRTTDADDGAADAPASGIDDTTTVVAPVDQDAAAEGDGADGGDGTSTHEPERAPISWGVVAALIAAGLAVWGAAAYGIYLGLLAPEEVAIPAETHVAGPPGPTIDPVAPEDPSDFLAAIPLTVSTFALTESVALDPFTAGLPERAAEAYDLTYSDGTVTATVRAIQHYTVEEATAAYERLVRDATDREAVLDAEGAEVGERAVLDESIVVWRNGTAVFISHGEDPEANLEMYRLFGL